MTRSGRETCTVAIASSHSVGRNGSILAQSCNAVRMTRVNRDSRSLRASQRSRRGTDTLKALLRITTGPRRISSHLNPSPCLAAHCLPFATIATASQTQQSQSALAAAPSTTTLPIDNAAGPGGPRAQTRLDKGPQPQPGRSSGSTRAHCRLKHLSKATETARKGPGAGAP